MLAEPTIYHFFDCSEGGVSQNPQSEYYGDIHYYAYFNDMWKDSTYQTPRCASEYGVQSLPNKVCHRHLHISIVFDHFRRH
jgi:hypothetical protein